MSDLSESSKWRGTCWVEFRQQMPVAQRWAYLDHAAVSPLPAPTRTAITDWAQDAALNGDTSWAAWSTKVDEVRHLFSSMLGAKLEEIALIRNTTEGINFVAEGYPWEAGDNVVTLAGEFPTNQYPWMNLSRRGVEVRRVPSTEGKMDTQRLKAACDRRTRILTVSWVSYSSGWRNDLDQLAEIAHNAGALLFVNAIQSLGVHCLDVRRTAIDFLAADGHKWLLGPEGAGVFFVRREHLDLLRPTGIGWNSVRHASDYGRIVLDLKESASRYEGGSQNIVGFLALRASLMLLAKYGAEELSQRIFAITDLASERLAKIGAHLRSDRSPEHKSGIVLFDLPGRDPMTVLKQCLSRGVVIRCRAGGLRISPHAYNNEEDIERLIDAVR